MNKFRDAMMRGCYDKAVIAYQKMHRDLFTANGKQKTGNGVAQYFWAGFNGLKDGLYNFDREAKKTVAYAHYRAGQDCRKSHDNCRENW